MLSQQISNDLTQAMKNKDAVRVSVLRMLVSAIHNKEIAFLKKDSGLSDEEVIQVVRTEVRKRREAADEFKKGGRQERAEQELAEAKLCELYLPMDLTDEELHVVVTGAIQETGAASEKDFGSVMRIVQAAIKGRASGERVAAMVRGKLGGNAS